MNKNDKNFKLPRKTTIVTFMICTATIAFAILLPKIVNCRFINGNYVTGADLTNKEWLGFWGSYLGGLLGSIAALVALFLTIHQQEKHHADAEESNRCLIMPAVICSLASKEACEDHTFSFLMISKNGDVTSYTTTTKERFKNFKKDLSCESFFYFVVKNIGLGPAFNVNLYVNDFQTSHSVHIGGLSSNGEKAYVISFEQSQSYRLYLRFQDAFENTYSAESKITYNSETKGFSFFATKPPKLI